jgi:UDP:flavonoid glycosyltransferase YjiC (YdhE family)
MLAGGRLDARVLPFRDVNGSRLVGELERLLADRQYQDNSREIAGKLTAVRGADCAAEALIAAAQTL